MDSLSSGRESEASFNASFEASFLNTSQARHAYEFRSYQSLTSVLNSPSSRFLDSVVSFFSFNETQPTPLMKIPHIEESDFKSFLGKISEQLHEYLHKKNPRLSELIGDCTSERCFQVVPSFFFEEAFDMRRVLADLHRQEDLNYYLDFTDVSLFRQIVDYWELFLQATHSLQSLQPEVCRAVSRVQELRSRLGSLKGSLLPKSIDIAEHHYRITNTGRVLELLRLIAAVKETQPAVQQLLSTGHFASALDLIQKSRQILLTKLKGLASLRNAAKELEGVQQMIERMVVEELSSSAVDLIAGSLMSQKDKLIKFIKGGGKGNAEHLFTFDSSKFDEFSKILGSLVVKSVLKKVSQQSAPVLKGGLKETAAQLGVIKADPEVKKWSVISHAHVELVLETFLHLFNQVTRRVQYVVDALQPPAQESDHSLQEALTEFRRTLFKPLAVKLTRILTSRSEIYMTSALDEVATRQVSRVNQLYLGFINAQVKDFSLAVRCDLVQVEKGQLVDRLPWGLPLQKNARNCCFLGRRELERGRDPCRDAPAH
jgi:hypothetical protein